MSWTEQEYQEYLKKQNKTKNTEYTKNGKIRLIFDIKPISKDNCKITNKYGRQFLPQKYKDWEEAIGYMARQQYKGKPLTKPLVVFCWFYFKDRICRDVGNYQKSILDALKGICFNDDSQIVDLHLFKRIIGEEKILIEIEVEK